MIHVHVLSFDYTHIIEVGGDRLVFTTNMCMTNCICNEATCSGKNWLRGFLCSTQQTTKFILLINVKMQQLMAF